MEIHDVPSLRGRGQVRFDLCEPGIHFLLETLVRELDVRALLGEVLIDGIKPPVDFVEPFVDLREPRIDFPGVKSFRHRRPSEVYHRPVRQQSRRHAVQADARKPLKDMMRLQRLRARDREIFNVQRAILC